MATIDPAPLDRGLARVGDRWTLLIVDALLQGAKRYSDLAHAVDGIAPNILAARLRKLERDGLIVAAKPTISIGSDPAGVPHPPPGGRFGHRVSSDGSADAEGTKEPSDLSRGESASCRRPRRCGAGARRRSGCGVAAPVLVDAAAA